MHDSIPAAAPATFPAPIPAAGAVAPDGLPRETADAVREAFLERLRAPLLAEQDALALSMLRACAAGDALPGVPTPPPGRPKGPFQLLPFAGDRFDWFAAGDVHGDLPALVACADAAVALARPDRTPVLAILGDLVDRGADSIACILFVLRLALGLDRARPGLKVLFVRGDHDVALRYEEATGEISAGVRPAELAERFRSPGSLFVREAAVVHAFVRFVAQCPAAVCLDNGTLLFHGGVPQGDLLPRLGLDLSLQSPECAQDFAWCRIEDGVRRKRPSRVEKTAEEGAENVAAFLDWLNARLAAAEADPGLRASLRAAGLGRLGPVAQIVRGHTHVPNGYLRYSGYPVPLHTVNSCHGDVPMQDPVRPVLVALREDAGAGAFEPVWPEELEGLPPLSTVQMPRPVSPRPIPRLKPVAAPVPVRGAPEPAPRSTSGPGFVRRAFRRLRGGVTRVFAHTTLLRRKRRAA